jgi:microsomal dipeptidase-like Zn-dependent dipeptidase/gamma-glutamyl-gamma-aminobutyrate hydrolase PuuD
MNTTISTPRPPDLEALFREADRFLPAGGSRQPPIPRIGLSVNRKDNTSRIAETYIEAILQAGAAPLLVPAITDIQALATIADSLDGLLISGGGDLNPLYLHEEPIPQLEDVDSLRDEYDLLLLRLAFNRGLPIFGICRGHQLIQAAFGGRLYQDIATQHPAASLKHSQALARELPSHTVRLTDKSSRLYTILKTDHIAVNSFHHQAVRDPAPGFIATATAPDGINEAAEHPEYPLLSVQWHPEAMAAHGDRPMQALFRHHVEEAALFARAKELHRRILTLDLHTDTPMAYAGTFDLGQRAGGTFNSPFTEEKVSLPLMEQGRLDAAFMAAYIPQGERTDDAYREAWAYTLDRLAQVLRQEKLHPSRVGIARTAADLRRLKQEGRKALVIAVENAYAIGKDLSRLETLRQMGVAYLTLCHNGHNDLCDSAIGAEPLWNGLSPLGREAVHEMNRLGLMIDLSHAADATFRDVLRESRLPVICSHSSVRALCDHPRNLSDEQIRALAAAGGVLHICLYAGFLRRGAEMGEATLSDAVRHINHAVRIAGIDHVGIGSDFDGGGDLVGCRAANELIRLTVRLLREGYSDADIQKIWGGNLLRVMDAVQSAAQT